MATRVLHLSYLGGLGGGETMWLSQLRALDRTLWEPRVICGNAGAFVDELRASGIAVDVMPYALPHFQNGWLPRLSLAFVPQLYNYLRAEKIQLVHCKDPQSAFYAAPIARLLNIPVVWTCTGWWHAERGWKSWFYETFFTRIITWTELIKQKLVDTNPRLGEKIVVVPSGVDISIFAPAPRDASARAELGISPQAQVVILLARFQPVKGHEFFLQAAIKILEKCPETIFLLVGDNAFATDEGETYKREMLAQIQNDARLQTHIVLAGFRRDVPRLLNASDILVCPSLFETYGMSNIEAMACGVPVVSTKVGGPSETIVDGETGFLVAPRDANALAEQVIRLLADAPLRKQMGAQARKRVKERFSLTENVARLEQVYRQALHLS